MIADFLDNGVISPILVVFLLYKLFPMNEVLDCKVYFFPSFSKFCGEDSPLVWQFHLGVLGVGGVLHVFWRWQY